MHLILTEGYKLTESVSVHAISQLTGETSTMQETETETGIVRK